MMRSDSALGVPSTVSNALPGNSMWIAPWKWTCSSHRQRLVRSLARNPHRQQLHSAAAAILQKTLLVGSPPGEHLVRVHRKLACHSRHRSSRRECRLDDPPLLLNRETLPPTASARTPCVQFHRFRMKQLNPTNQTDSPDAYETVPFGRPSYTRVLKSRVYRSAGGNSSMTEEQTRANSQLHFRNLRAFGYSRTLSESRSDRLELYGNSRPLAPPCLSASIGICEDYCQALALKRF